MTDDDVRELVARLRIQPAGIPFGAPDLARAAAYLDAAVALAEALLQHGSHTANCAAYKVIGRFGGRAGLMWNVGDEKTCDCGLGKALAAWRAAGGSRTDG